MRLGEEHMRANMQDQGLVFVCCLQQLDQYLRFQQLSIWNGKSASRRSRRKLRSELHWERKNSEYKKAGNP
jgi:predicted kinase